MKGLDYCFIVSVCADFGDSGDFGFFPRTLFLMNVDPNFMVVLVFFLR